MQPGERLIFIMPSVIPPVGPITKGCADYDDLYRLITYPHSLFVNSEYMAFLNQNREANGVTITIGSTAANSCKVKFS
jgi:hypothetical protein